MITAFFFVMFALLATTADACSCMPTHTLNNAMHTAKTVVRVWVNWEMKSPHIGNLRGDDDDYDFSPRYYMVTAMDWYKKDDSADMQEGKFIVQTSRYSSMCGATLPLKQQAVLFGGTIGYQHVPGFAGKQAIMSISSCGPHMTNFPLQKKDWETLHQYQAGVCHMEDCGPTVDPWGGKGMETLLCKDNSTVVTSTCTVGSDPHTWQGCQWQTPDVNDCP